MFFFAFELSLLFAWSLLLAMTPAIEENDYGIVE
jgi:hypothetical protein